MAQKNIFLYVPNLIGYGRLALLAAAFYYMDGHPDLFLNFYCSSILLDGFDGYAARKLNQESTFGAWLDVVIDNFSRTMVWVYVSQFGWLVSSLEWTVLVCTHTLGKQWKTASRSPPVWVQAVMANGFKTPAGAFAILGLHCLPIWFYLQKAGLACLLFAPCMQAFITITLCSGRLLCMSVECWFIYNHIRDMADMDLLVQIKQDEDSDTDDDDDEVNDDEVDDSKLHDDVNEEATPSDEVGGRPKQHKPVRREGRRGPSIRPTAGSTMIDMGFTSEGKEKKAEEPQDSGKRRGSTPEGAPQRRRPSGQRESPTRRGTQQHTSPTLRRHSTGVRRNKDDAESSKPADANIPQRHPREGQREQSQSPRARRRPGVNRLSKPNNRENIRGESAPSSTSSPENLPEKGLTVERKTSDDTVNKEINKPEENLGSSSPPVRQRKRSQSPRTRQRANTGETPKEPAQPRDQSRSPRPRRRPVDKEAKAQADQNDNQKGAPPSAQQIHPQERRESPIGRRRPRRPPNHNREGGPVDQSDNTSSPDDKLKQRERGQGPMGKRGPRRPTNAHGEGGPTDHDDGTLPTDQPNPQERRQQGRRPRRLIKVDGERRPASPSAQQIRPQGREGLVGRTRPRRPPNEDGEKGMVNQNDGTSSPNHKVNQQERRQSPLGKRRPRRPPNVDGERRSSDQGEDNSPSPQQINQERTEISLGLEKARTSTAANGDNGKTSPSHRNDNEESTSTSPQHPQERKRSIFGKRKAKSPKKQDVKTGIVDDDNQEGIISPSGSVHQLNQQERKQSIFGKRKSKVPQSHDGKIGSNDENNNQVVITPVVQNEPSPKGRRSIFGKRKPSKSQKDETTDQNNNQDVTTSLLVQQVTPEGSYQNQKGVIVSENAVKSDSRDSINQNVSVQILQEGSDNDDAVGKQTSNNEGTATQNMGNQATITQTGHEIEEVNLHKEKKSKQELISNSLPSVSNGIT